MRSVLKIAAIAATVAASFPAASAVAAPADVLGGVQGAYNVFTFGGPLYTTGEFHDAPSGVRATAPLSWSAALLMLGLTLLLMVARQCQNADTHRQVYIRSPKDWWDRIRLSRTDWSQHPDW